VTYISSMAGTAQTHRDEPILPGAAPADEARVFHDIVRGITQKLGRLPDGVQGVDFRFGEDSTGAPAVWVLFKGPDDLKPSKDKIAAMQRFANEVTSEIFRSGSERWPYVEFAAD
jgi:hypothetical protein